MDSDGTTQTSPRWQHYTEILHDAYTFACSSTDPSTQNAAVLVREREGRPGGGTVLEGTWAVNALPLGVIDSPERWERPLKYAAVEHAERNSIYRAARAGIATEGLTMVCPWEPCTDCARAVIQSGVVRLVTHMGANARTPESWRASIALARTMLREAGVEVVDLDAVLGAPSVRHSGEYWHP